MNNFKPLSQPLLKIFSIAELHHAYWKEFCDACYAHFGFETNEIRTYEQKYETFCHCKCFVTEEDGYEEKLLAVAEEDLRQLKTLEAWFYSQNESIDIIPSLYIFIRKIWTLKVKVRNDRQLISYICPRCMNIDYFQYLLNENIRFTQKAINWQSIREVLENSTDYALLKEMMTEEEFNHYTEDFEHLEELEDGGRNFTNVLFVGEAGTGKTARVFAWAKANDVNIVLVNASSMDDTDLGGVISKGEHGEVVRLATTEMDELGTEERSVLFLDEYNRAPREVRTNLLELVNSHVVPDSRAEGGQRFLPNFLFTVAAINPPNGRYNTDEMDDAERSRFRTVDVAFDPINLNQFLSKRFDKLADDPDNDEDERLEYIRKKAIANRLLTNKKFSFDTPEDMDTGRDRYGENYKPLNYRSFTLLLDQSDGTKEDVLALWPQFVNAGKKRMAEDILSDYVDVDDKANAALAKGTKSDVFAKTTTPWDTLVNKYGDQLGL